MFTVHASGGAEMLQAARRGADKGAKAAGLPAPTMLAVTVLTSSNDETLASIGVNACANDQVIRLAKLAVGSGADGIVCSPRESAQVREAIGEEFSIVTPGVRPEWASADDQKRVMTPSEAMLAGSTHLVVGRPITGHSEPKAAAQAIINEIAGVL
jgi:orotidine-5'-phosphate decarboxylase